MGMPALFFRRLVAALLMPRLIFLAQHRGADLFLATLWADNPDQVRAAERDAVRLADRVKLFDVLAGHDRHQCGYSSGRRRHTVQWSETPSSGRRHRPAVEHARILT